MNEDVKKLWTDSLVNGEYKQTQGVLRTEGGGYCCLGVLCDLYVKQHPSVLGWQKASEELRDDGGMRFIDASGFGSISYLPPDVMKWAGLQSPDPFVEDSDKRERALSDVNDHGTSFSEIAKAIEKSL